MEEEAEEEDVVEVGEEWVGRAGEGCWLWGEWNIGEVGEMTDAEAEVGEKDDVVLT